MRNRAWTQADVQMLRLWLETVKVGGVLLGRLPIQVLEAAPKRLSGSFSLLKLPSQHGLKYKTLKAEVLEAEDTGGSIRITTSSTDRDSDRVISSGIVTDAYFRNPVVLFGHNYSDPWAIIGKTISLDLGPDFIDAKFELRRPANYADPQNIVRLLWGGGYVKAASIGFRPIEYEPNDEGGFDHIKVELVEWSLVPVGANSEALRRALKTV